MILGDQLLQRSNNLNLIRAIAATAVLVSHAYPLTQGSSAIEPLESFTGNTLGHMAVLVFFAISGFLISASFERSHSVRSFTLARAARLFPGLAASILLVALVMGPLVTTLPPQVYMTDPDTWSFIVKNVTTIRVQFSLPGVFETNPMPSVEGSIWTLMYEIACYMCVGFAGYVGLMARRSLATPAIVVYLAVTLAFAASGNKTFYQLDQFFKLSQPFALGALAYLWRDRLPVYPAGLAVMVAALFVLPLGLPYDFLLVIVLTYASLVLAIVPAGFIRAYNGIGDYSYGIYVYAFPIQGLMVWLTGSQTPLQNMLTAFPLTLFFSVLSWHLIEKPVLDHARRKLKRPKSGSGDARRTSPV